jgi:hypothetical protein
LLVSRWGSASLSNIEHTTRAAGEVRCGVAG